MRPSIPFREIVISLALLGIITLLLSLFSYSPEGIRFTQSSGFLQSISSDGHIMEEDIALYFVYEPSQGDGPMPVQTTPRSIYLSFCEDHAGEFVQQVYASTASTTISVKRAYPRVLCVIHSLEPLRMPAYEDDVQLMEATTVYVPLSSVPVELR